MTGAEPREVDDLTVVSLFAGIGGLDLGLHRAGVRVIGQVEIDPFCRSVLAHHWPEVPRHDDVRTAIDWWRAEPRPHVDLVAGGFPCQPVSTAGLGLAQDDPRWLWDPMREFIAAIGPEWVLFENVPGLRTRGLHLVVADLEALGYTVRVGSLSACAVGAPHVRRRLLGVAHAPSKRRGTRRPGRPSRQAPHRPHQPTPRMGTPRHRDDTATHWAREPRVDRLVDGLPPGLAERQLRALGNAVVPAVAEHLGRLIVTEHRAQEGR